MTIREKKICRAATGMYWKAIFWEFVLHDTGKLHKKFRVKILTAQSKKCDLMFLMTFFFGFSDLRSKLKNSPANKGTEMHTTS